MSEDDKTSSSDPEAIRKAEVQKARDSIVVTSVKIEEPDEEEKEEVKTDEQEKEDSKEEGEKEDIEAEKEDDVEDNGRTDRKEELHLQKKTERLEKKIAREAQKRREAEKRIKELEAKLAADPEQKLTAEDVETLAEKKSEEKARIRELNKAADALADGAQKQLKLTNKQWIDLRDNVIEEIGNIPAIVVDVLSEIDNGPSVIAYLFKNVDEAEEIYKLKDRPAKLGLELAKLATKLAMPKPKKISQVPDAVEPLGGKSAGGDRLAILASKKNLTSSEMAEYVQMRNAEVAQKRANGRSNLR